MNTKDNLNHGFLKLRPVQSQKSTFIGAMGVSARVKFFVLTGLFAFTLFTGLFFLAENRLFVAFERSTEADRILVLAGNLKLSIANARSAEKAFLISKERNFAREFQGHLVIVSKVLTQLSKIPVIANQQKNLDTIRDGLAQYDAKFSMLLSSQNFQEPKGSKRLKLDLQLAADEARQFDDLLSYLAPSTTSVVEFSKGLQKSRNKDLTFAQDISRIIIVCSGACLFGVLTLIGLMVIRSFSNSLGKLALVARRLAKENNLDLLSTDNSLDTTGEIARALGHWEEAMSDLYHVRQELDKTQRIIKEASHQGEVADVRSTNFVPEAHLPKKIEKTILNESSSELSKQDFLTSQPDDSISSASQQLASFSQYVNVSANDVERTGALIKGLDNTTRQFEEMSALVISIRDQTNLLSLRSVQKYSNSNNMGFSSDEVTKVAIGTGLDDSDISHCIDVIRDATNQAEGIATSVRQIMAEVTRMAREIAITASEQAIEATTKLLSQSEHLQNLLGDVISKVEPSKVVSSEEEKNDAGEPIVSQT